MASMLRVMVALFACFASVTLAQTWPAKPVRVIVSNAAGSAVDIAARMLADHLGRNLGQPFIVDNRVGAEGAIGAEAAARSASDGYTFYFSTNVALVTSPFMLKSLPYDAARDFTPVAMIVDSAPFLIVVNPGVAARSLPELIKLAKDNPGKLSYGTTSPLANVIGEWWSRAAGIQMQQIWYKSVPQSIQDTVAGTTQIAINAQPLVESLAKAGKLRILAITSRKRFAPLGDVPTMDEALQGFVVEGFFMLMAPTGTPAAITQRVNREASVFVKQAEVIQRMYGFGLSVPPDALTPQAMNEFLHAQREHWARVFKSIDYKPE